MSQCWLLHLGTGSISSYFLCTAWDQGWDFFPSDTSCFGTICWTNCAFPSELTRPFVKNRLTMDGVCLFLKSLLFHWFIRLFTLPWPLELYDQFWNQVPLPNIFLKNFGRVHLHVITKHSACKTTGFCSPTCAPRYMLENALAQTLSNLHVPEPVAVPCPWHLLLITASPSLVPACWDPTVSLLLLLLSLPRFLCRSFPPAVPSPSWWLWSGPPSPPVPPPCHTLFLCLKSSFLLSLSTKHGSSRPHFKCSHSDLIWGPPIHVQNSPLFQLFAQHFPKPLLEALCICIRSNCSPACSPRRQGCHLIHLFIPGPWHGTWHSRFSINVW